MLVASASIPGVFAPVLIEVESNGRRFAEMHVDGGLTHNVFIVPDAILINADLLPAGTPGRIFVVMNDKLATDFDVVQDRLPSIVQRSVSTMVKANTIRALLSAHQFARSRGLEFHLAAIDPSFSTSKTITFDQAGAKKYYDEAYKAGWAGIVRQSPEHGPKLQQLFSKAK